MTKTLIPRPPLLAYRNAGNHFGAQHRSLNQYPSPLDRIVAHHKKWAGTARYKPMSWHSKERSARRQPPPVDLNPTHHNHPMSDSTLAQGFYTEFQVTRNDFAAQLSTATSSQISELSAQLVVLRKRFADARSFLPPYDQRQYEMQLKSWERALEQLQLSQTSTGAKQKFTFKRKDRSEKLPPSAPEIEVSIPPEASNIPFASHLSLTSKSGCLLTRTSLPDASSIPIDSGLIITNLDNCIVDLMCGKTPAMNPTAVHIRNVTNCVLLLPVISGSILLEALQRCVVAIPDCHQFRMHTSRRVDVYLPTTAKPVIENCGGIHFSEYPTKFSVSAGEPKNEFQVEDFSHIRQTQSPNWSPRHDNAAVFDRWLNTFRSSSSGADALDLQKLDEILPCVGDEGSG